jgi:hypothetical protein
MAKVWITEVAEMSFMQGGERIQAVQLPPVKEQAFEFSTATRSLPFSARVRAIRVRADADAHITIGGDNVVADTNSLPITAKAAEYFGVLPGQYLSIVAAA